LRRYVCRRVPGQQAGLAQLYGLAQEAARAAAQATARYDPTADSIDLPSGRLLVAIAQRRETRYCCSAWVQL